MKTIKQIAKETSREPKEIYTLMKSLGIIPTKNKFLELDQYQEELIHHNLYCCGKLEYLIFESNINTPITHYPIGLVG